MRLFQNSTTVYKGLVRCWHRIFNGKRMLPWENNHYLKSGSARKQSEGTEVWGYCLFISLVTTRQRSPYCNRVQLILKTYLFCVKIKQWCTWLLRLPGTRAPARTSKQLHTHTQVSDRCQGQMSRMKCRMIRSPMCSTRFLILIHKNICSWLTTTATEGEYTVKLLNIYRVSFV